MSGDMPWSVAVRGPGFPPLDYLTLSGKVLQTMAFYDIQKPLYSCYRYSGDFCKVVKFKRHAGDLPPRMVDKEEQEKANDRFLASLSRSRSAVLQYALSNDWGYFFTGTIDGSKHDRFDLNSFACQLSQMVRDYRKRTGYPLRYLFVPEPHKDGAWHIHGLLSGLAPASVLRFVSGVHPQKLVDGGFFYWSEYLSKFGFCSLGPVRDPVKTAFYVSKYITKDLGENIRSKNSHMYFCSHGLKKASRVGDCYVGNTFLDNVLSHDYDFCSLGYAHIPWVSICDLFDGVQFSENEQVEVKPVQVSIEDFREWRDMQLAIPGYR